MLLNTGYGHSVGALQGLSIVPVAIGEPNLQLLPSQSSVKLSEPPLLQ